MAVNQNTRVDQDIRKYIDSSIRNGMSDRDFGEALQRIITDIFTLRLRADPQFDPYPVPLETAMHTSAYLAYRISSELMRSTNQAAQYRYALAVGGVLSDIYNNPIYGGAFSHRRDEPNDNHYGLRIFANFYSFHAGLLRNGITSNGNTSLADVPRSCLTTIVQSTYGPSIGYIRIIGNDLPDPNIRVISPSRSTYDYSYIQIGTHRSNRFSIQDLRVATWNMQGASAATEDKLGNVVSQLAGNSNIVCLQELGEVPGTAACSHFAEDQFGNAYCVLEHSWNLGTTSRPRILRIYFFSVGRIRVNLGFAYYEDRFPYHVNRFLVIADGIDSGLRPAIGMEITPQSSNNLGDAVSIFSFHAISGGGPNAARMIRECNRHVSTPFAILGDFNRDPRPSDPTHTNRRGNWISPPQIAEIVPANTDTHGSGSDAAMLDYAVISNNATSSDLGRVFDLHASDHMAVNMRFSFYPWGS